MTPAKNKCIIIDRYIHRNKCINHTASYILVSIHAHHETGNACGLSHRCIDTKNSELPHLAFFPIELGFGEPRYRLGNPRFCSDRGIIERLAQMYAPYGAKITINAQGIGVVELK